MLRVPIDGSCASLQLHGTHTYLQAPHGFQGSKDRASHAYEREAAEAVLHLGRARVPEAVYEGVPPAASTSGAAPIPTRRLKSFMPTYVLNKDGSLGTCSMLMDWTSPTAVGYGRSHIVYLAWLYRRHRPHKFKTAVRSTAPPDLQRAIQFQQERDYWETQYYLERAYLAIWDIEREVGAVLCCLRMLCLQQPTPCFYSTLSWIQFR
jgi:hypothetical protein